MGVAVERHDEQGPDIEWVARIRRRDQVALGEVYDRYAPLLFALGRKITADAGLVEDAIQQAFMDVWRRIDTYDPTRGRLSTWLANIVKNRIVDQLRKSHVQRELASDFDSPPAAESTPEGPRPAESSAVDRTWVRQALAELPEPLRQVVWLAYFQGLTQSEIADHLGWPLGTVKTRMRQAMQRLGAALGEAHGEGRVGR